MIHMATSCGGCSTACFTALLQQVACSINNITKKHDSRDHPTLNPLDYEGRNHFLKSIIFFFTFALGRNKIRRVGRILFWPVHVKENVRIIEQYRKIRSRPRNFGLVNRFWNFKPQNFASVAPVTWKVGSSKFAIKMTAFMLSFIGFGFSNYSLGGERAKWTIFGEIS